jgi:hypothetical protein
MHNRTRMIVAPYLTLRLDSGNRQPQLRERLDYPDPIVEPAA